MDTTIGDFKTASIGELPDNWSCPNLGRVTEKAQYGLSLPSGQSGIPYLKMSSIKDGKVKVESADRIELPENEIEKYALEPGDIVFNRTNSFDLVGKSALFTGWNEPVVFASYLVRLKVKLEVAEPSFIAQWLISDFARYKLKSIATPGVSQTNINPTVLRRTFPVPLPPLPEQKKIAEILSTWDEAVDTLTRLIEAKQRQKKALMQQLLTGKKRLPGFEGNFHYKRASEVFTNISVRNKQGAPLLSVTQDNGVVLRSDIERKINQDETKTHTYKVVESGDYVISLRSFQGGLEYSSLLGAVSPAYHVIRPILEIDEDYYRLYFKSYDFVGHLAVAVIGIRDGKQISFSDFSFLNIPYPDPKEQKAIAAVLNTADEEIALLTQQKEALETQKRGLMQRLLTGKVRVQV